MERPPVILRMDVHCLDCAKKIRKAIKPLYGVKSVWAAPETGLVVVTGNANASVLQWHIQSKLTRGAAVTIVSDGQEVAPADAWRRMAAHSAPPPNGYQQLAHAQPPQGYSTHLAPHPQGYPHLGHAQRPHGYPAHLAPRPQDYYPPSYTGMVHLAPPQGYTQPAYPPNVGGAWNSNHIGWAPVRQVQRYVPIDRQYVPNEAPVYFTDDNPNSCCVV